MENFKIAVVQMNALRGQLDHNLEIHQRFTREAAADGCRMVAFPELSVTAHYGASDVTALAEEATQGRIYDEMRALAQELDVVIGYGFCERAHGTFFNAYALMGPGGLVGVQRKVHASHDEYFSFRMGGQLAVFDLGFCRVGVAVCLDAGFFEVWRVLVLQGAEVVLLPHAARSGWGKQIPEAEQRQSLARTLGELPGKYGIYAKDNAVYAVYGNQVDFNGHSTHGGGTYVLGPDSTVLSCADPVLDDLWISAELDAERLQEARNAGSSQLRMRRPEVYGALTEMV